MTCDMWHMTGDTWHVTHDMWHVTCCGGWTFSQHFSSLALTVCDLWYYEDLEEKDHWLNEWINQSISHEAVYRTAPATPGLLKTIPNSFSIFFQGRVCYRWGYSVWFISRALLAITSRVSYYHFWMLVHCTGPKGNLLKEQFSDHRNGFIREKKVKKN